MTNELLRLKYKIKEWLCKHNWRRSKFVALVAGSTAPMICTKCGKHDYDQ